MARTSQKDPTIKALLEELKMGRLEVAGVVFTGGVGLTTRCIIGLSCDTTAPLS